MSAATVNKSSNKERMKLYYEKRKDKKKQKK